MSLNLYINAIKKICQKNGININLAKQDALKTISANVIDMPCIHYI